MFDIIEIRNQNLTIGSLHINVALLSYFTTLAHDHTNDSRGRLFVGGK